MTDPAQHGPLGNSWFLVSIFGLLLAFSIWKLTPEWAFLIMLFSVIIFLSSFISAVRAPLLSDDEIEIAVHEKYHGRRYPDTDLHEGHLPKKKKLVHSRHKKKLVQLVTEDLAKPAKKAAKKAAPKKKVTKKAVPKKKAAKKKTSKKRR
jgi:hypothetical protein